MHIQHRRHHLERVERVTVFGGVDFRVLDAEFCLVKVSAYARKQIWLIWRVDHHLQAFAQR